MTLEDLQFHSLAPKIILAEMSARNLIIRNCVFNQTASTYEGSTSIVIDGNLAPSVDNILILIGPGKAWAGPSQRHGMSPSIGNQAS